MAQHKGERRERRQERIKRLTIEAERIAWLKSDRHLCGGQMRGRGREVERKDGEREGNAD